MYVLYNECGGGTIGIVTNPEYADEMFQHGYEFGIKNMDTITKLLMLYTIEHLSSHKKIN
jgi:hypothetical protein